MERQRSGGKIECVGNLAHGGAFRPDLDQISKYREAAFLSQRAERGERIFCFHISNIMETFEVVKQRMIGS
jgi:hypothetical protein